MSRQRQYEKVITDDIGDSADNSDVDEEGVATSTASKFGNAFQRLSEEDDSCEEMFDIVDDDRTEPTSNVHRHSLHSQHSDGKLTPATLPETPADGMEQAHSNHELSDRINPFSSFDLDDDELDDLQRYDFHSNRDSERLHSYVYATNERRQSQRSSSGGDNFVSSSAMALYMLWDILRTARLESRRRRAERLLAVPDEHYIERSCLFLSSWCDLTDRGMYLLIAVVFAWMVAVVALKNFRLIMFGVPLITLRILLRPAYWYLWGRRVQQKRQATMALYDELNGGSPVGGGRVVIELPVPINATDGEEDSGNQGGGEFPGDFVLPPFESEPAGDDHFADEFEPGLDDVDRYNSDSPEVEKGRPSL